jgi:hypothetical protein
MDPLLGVFERRDLAKIELRESLAEFLRHTKKAVQSTYWDSHGELVDVLDLAAVGCRSTVGTR